MVLESLRVAEPCHADWDAMDGDLRSRHCASCDLRVTDLSQLTRVEAETLLTTRTPGGRVCVRYTVGADGQVVTRTTQQQRLVDVLTEMLTRRGA